MNEQTKICPMLSVGRADFPTPCMGDRCAWWHPHACKCILQSITEDITDAAASLEDLANGNQESA